MSMHYSQAFGVKFREVDAFGIRSQFGEYDRDRVFSDRAQVLETAHSGALKRLLNPGDQLGVHFLDRAPSDLVIAHAVRRLSDQPGR